MIFSSQVAIGSNVAIYNINQPRDTLDRSQPENDLRISPENSDMSGVDLVWITVLLYFIRIRSIRVIMRI